MQLNGGQDYKWNPTDGLSCSDCPDPFITPSAITSYEVISTNIFGCIDTFVLDIQSGTSIANAGEDKGNCGLVDNIEIGINSYPTGYKFKWEPATGLSDPNIANPTVYLEPVPNEDFSIVYELTVESPEGCIDKDTVEVTAENSGSINIDKGDSLNLVLGQTAELIVSGYKLGATYEWEPKKGLNTDSGAIVIAQPSENTTYTVFGTSKYGCKAETSIEIIVDDPPTLRSPTAFSPNGDNLNDVFRFIEKEVSEILTFKIVNRWGELVYDGNSNNFQGWDGKRDGIEQPIGVYVFTVEYLLIGNERTQQKQGHFTLIR